MRGSGNSDPQDRIHDGNDIGVYAFLARFDAEARRAFVESLRPVAFSRDEVIVAEADLVEHLVLITRGELRVVRWAGNGREITLYHVQAGELCVLALGAVLAGRSYPATARTSCESRGFSIPANHFRAFFERERALRDFVVTAFAHRVEETLGLVTEVAFAPLERRLARLLLDRSRAEGSGKPVVHLTHSEIADQLGTAREVVSRLLRRLVMSGSIDVARGRIVLLDIEEIESFTNAGG